MNIISTDQEGFGYFRKYKMYKALISLAGTTEAASGSLIVGEMYSIAGYQDGDDFTNVGGVNEAGSTFLATGTTPAVWSNESLLAHYPKPVATVLENDLGGDVSFAPNPANASKTMILSDGLFTVGKTIVKGDASGGADIDEEHTSTDEIFLGGGWEGAFGAHIEIQVYP